MYIGQHKQSNSWEKLENSVLLSVLLRTVSKSWNCLHWFRPLKVCGKRYLKTCSKSDISSLTEYTFARSTADVVELDVCFLDGAGTQSQAAAHAAVSDHSEMKFYIAYHARQVGATILQNSIFFVLIHCILRYDFRNGAWSNRRWGSWSVWPKALTMMDKKIFSQFPTSFQLVSRQLSWKALTPWVRDVGRKPTAWFTMQVVCRGSQVTLLVKG